MKKIVAGILACSLLFCVSAKADNLIIASEGSYPPFNYVDSNNKLQGFDIDIAYALCEKMQAQCTLVSQDWEGLIPGLIAKKFDAVIASMVPTPERLTKVDFTNKYYTTKIALAAPKDSDIKDINPASYKGKTIGAQAGTVQAYYADDHYVPEGAILKLYPTPEEANSDILNHRLDAVIIDKFPLISWLENDGKDCCKYLGEIEETKAPTSIAIRKKSDELKTRFNKAIDDIRADGTYDKIAQKYFKGDIY